MQNDLWETDPGVDKITTNDAVLLELIAAQNVFTGGLEGMLVYFTKYCFTNIIVRNKVVSQFAFKVLNKIILIKNSINRACFKSLRLYQFIANHIFSALETLEVNEENLERRELLFEATGTCFLSDHLDEYIQNSHLILNKIFDAKGIDSLPTHVYNSTDPRLHSLKFCEILQEY